MRRFFALLIVASLPLAGNAQSLGSSSDPSTCTGTDGSINIDNASISQSYTISYKKDGTVVSAFSVTSDAAGEILLSSLAAGSYTDFSLYDGTTTTNIAGPVTLTDPTAPAVPSVSVNNPVCKGGDINLSTTTATGVSYSWSGPNSFTSNVQNPVINSVTSSNDGSYTLVITDNTTLCTNQASLTVTVKPTPTVNAITDQAVCNGGTTTAVHFAGSMSTATYNWTNTTASTGLAASGSGDISAFTATNTGNTTVISTITVTPDAAGCPGNAETFDIAVNPTPQVNVANDTICNGTSSHAINFTSNVSSATYAWTNNNTTIGLAASGTGNIAPFTANNPGTLPITGTVTVTPSANSCTGSPATFNIVVENYVVPSMSLTTNTGTTICQGVAVEFNAVPVNGGQTPSYQWTLNGNNVGINSYSYTNTGSLSNGDVVSVTMASSLKCLTPATVSKSATITVLPFVVPTASISVNPGNAICSGTNVTFTATAGNAGTAPKYQWKKNGVNVGTNSATFSSTTLNNFDVITCVITSDAPCPASTTSNGISMNVTPMLTPTVTISPSPAGPSSCYTTAIFFTAVPFASGTNPSYVWKVDGNVVGNGNSYTDPGTLSVGAHTITCTMTSNYSCQTTNTSIGTLNRTISPIVAPTISIASASAPSGNVCVGSSVTFTATTTNAGSSPVYQWKKNGVNVGSNSATYAAGTGLVAGDVITCDLISNAPCIFPTGASSNAITISIWPNVVSSVSIATGNHCIGLPLTFTATPVNVGTAPVYQWKKNGSNVGTNSPVYTDATLTTGATINCVVTPSIPCALPAPVTSNTITMNMIPVTQANVNINVSVDSVGCEGTPMIFTAYFNNGGSTPAFQWYLNGATIPGANQSVFSSNAMTNGDKVLVKMTSSAACVFPVNSNVIGAHITTTVVPSVEVGGTPDANGSGITFYSTVTNGGTTPGYQWRKNGAEVAGETGPTYHSASNNPYDKIAVVVHSSMPCANPENIISKTIQPIQVTSVGELSSSISDLNLFPNPNGGVFNLTGSLQQMTAKEIEAEVINAVGQVVYRNKVLMNNANFDLRIDLGNNAAPGMYMVRLQVEGRTSVLRFSVN